MFVICIKDSLLGTHSCLNSLGNKVQLVSLYHQFWVSHFCLSGLSSFSFSQPSSNINSQRHERLMRVNLRLGDLCFAPIWPSRLTGREISSQPAKMYDLNAPLVSLTVSLHLWPALFCTVNFSFRTISSFTVPKGQSLILLCFGGHWHRSSLLIVSLRVLLRALVICA